ncbi:MAG: arylesterase [Vicinamibacterales bacterium]
MSVRLPRFLFLVALLLQAACGGADAPAPPAAAPASPPPAAGPASPEPASGRPRVVFLGDSLTAGLGLPVEESYPSLIQARLDAAGYGYEVINAGVSGDTSAGGLRRLEWVLDGPAKVLVVALGGNDGLRGLDPGELRRNLTAIIEAGRQRGLTVVLAGMEAPPNFGADYTARFREVYQDLAREYDLAFIPFLLQGVAGDPALNQADGIHPNRRGAEIVAETVWRALEPVLGAPATETVSR